MAVEQRMWPSETLATNLKPAALWITDTAWPTL